MNIIYALSYAAAQLLVHMFVLLTATTEFIQNILKVKNVLVRVFRF